MAEECSLARQYCLAEMRRDMEAKGIAELISKGGVISGMEGSTTDEIYKAVCQVIPLPEGITKETLYTALVEREKVLSTAVGNGIALPHARAPILKSLDDQEICVVYLKNPINMGAPDEKSVFVMFFLLTANPQVHLDILSSLVSLFRKPAFYKLLEEGAGKERLIEMIGKLD